MFVKKLNGKIYGATFTEAEKKAMEIEIKRQLKEYEREHATELTALILWEIHEQLGLGKKRLERFYKGFDRVLRSWLEKYELGEGDADWFCMHRLKEIGVDLEKLREEEK